MCPLDSLVLSVARKRHMKTALVSIALMLLALSLSLSPSAHALYQMQGNVREFWHTFGIMRVLICSGSSCT